MPSVKKNIFKNGLASLFEKSVKVLEQLFLVPFFISAWGAAYYGEWLTLTIVPSIIAFSDLGFGTAAANSFVLEYAAKNYQRAANINKTGLYVISIMVIIASVLSLGTMLILNRFDIFEKSLINKTDAIIAVSILILARLLNFYSQLFEAYYRAARRAALGINLLSVKAALNLGAGLVVLLLGYGVIEFAISQLVVILFFNVGFALKGRTVLGTFNKIKGEKNRSELKEITKKGIGYLMSPMWQAVYFQGTTFVVRIILGPEAVAVFNTVRTLSRSVNQLFNMVNASVFPELQYELGAGNLDKAKKVFRASVMAVLGVAILGAITLALFGLWFYGVWTHNELELPPMMWYLFVVGILFNALWFTAGVVFRAMNKPYQLSLAGLVVSFISVGTSYFLAQKMDLVGAALGSLVMDVLMAIYILPTSSKLLNMSVVELFTDGIKDLLDLKKIALGKIKK